MPYPHTHTALPSASLLTTTLIDTLADLGCDNSSLGRTLRLWVFSQLSPSLVSWVEVKFKGKSAEGQHSDPRRCHLWSEMGKGNSHGWSLRGFFLPQQSGELFVKSKPELTHHWKENSNPCHPLVFTVTLRLSLLLVAAVRSLFPARAQNLDC